MSEYIDFTVLGKPEPQGSIRAFMIGGKPRLTSANAKMKPWRQQVGMMALAARPTSDIWAGRHVPVRVHYIFVLDPPAKMPKGRTAPSVKPDIDKLIRACTDALTGIIYVDDGQVVECAASKQYGQPTRTVISVEKI